MTDELNNEHVRPSMRIVKRDKTPYRVTMLGGTVVKRLSNDASDALRSTRLPLGRDLGLLLRDDAGYALGASGLPVGRNLVVADRAVLLAGGGGGSGGEVCEDGLHCE
jgi:hypothetical protein